MSGKDKNQIIQIAIAPDTVTPLRYKTEMINDVFHTKGVAFPLQYKVLENKDSWHWQMSFPISVLGSKDLRRFNMNFRRYSPDYKLLWNKFFASAAEAASNMGFVSIKGGSSAGPQELGFREGRIKNEIGNWFLNAGDRKSTRLNSSHAT